MFPGAWRCLSSELLRRCQSKSAQSLDRLFGLVILGLSGQFAPQIVEPVFVHPVCITWKAIKGHHGMPGVRANAGRIGPRSCPSPPP